MAAHGRSWPIRRLRAVEHKIKAQGCSGTRCELTWGQDWSRGCPLRAYDGKRRTVTLKRSPARVSDEYRAVEHRRKVSATSHDGDEARQAAHGGWTALRWRIGCGLDLGGDFGEHWRDGWCSGWGRELRAAGRVFRGEKTGGGGIARVRSRVVVALGSCPARTRGGRRPWPPGPTW